MLNITHARQEYARALDEMDGILAKAKAENNRGLTQGESERFDLAEREARMLGDKIHDAERQLSAHGIESRGAYNPFTGLTGGTAPSYGGPFTRFGEQLRAVIAAGTPGSTVDQRLYEVRAASGMNEGVPSEGGFLLQSSYSYDLLQLGMSQAKLAPLCKPFPIGANSNSISLPMNDETTRATGSRFGGIQLAWAAEGGTISATKPKTRRVELNLKKLTGACYLTDELIQDASVLEAYVRSAFASEFGFVIDDAIFRGTGAGQPLGFLSSGSLVTVSKEGSQSADTIVTENVVKMYARSSNPAGSVWLANIDTFPQLSTLTLAVGTGGGPVGLLKEGMAASPTGLTMLGRPVIWCEQSSTLGDVGDLAFCDFQRYLLASKGGLQTAISMHVRFLQDESVIRFVYRLDGQPDTDSAVTPYKGAAGVTVSPFVVLEAR